MESINKISEQIRKEFDNLAKAIKNKDADAEQKIKDRLNVLIRNQVKEIEKRFPDIRDQAEIYIEKNYGVKLK